MTMLEKAAKALAKFADDDFTENRQFWIEHTLVVLDAIREPDGETLNAGSGATWGHEPDATYDAWQAMIDHIRSGK